MVDLLTDDSANAITYFTAQHFGSNAYYGQLYTAYGQYEDVLVKTGSGWRISNRQLVYMVSYNCMYRRHSLNMAHIRDLGAAISLSLTIPCRPKNATARSWSNVFECPVVVIEWTDGGIP